MVSRRFGSTIRAVITAATTSTIMPQIIVEILGVVSRAGGLTACGFAAAGAAMLGAGVPGIVVLGVVVLGVVVLGTAMLGAVVPGVFASAGFVGTVGVVSSYMMMLNSVSRVQCSMRTRSG